MIFIAEVVVLFVILQFRIVCFCFIYNLVCFVADLIDDITDGVTRTDQRLMRTEAKVQKVTKKAGSCGKVNLIF